MVALVIGLLGFSNNVATLEALNVTTKDQGEYQCVARNEHGVSISRGYLTVKEESFERRSLPPQFTRGLREQYRASVDEATLECRLR